MAMQLLPHLNYVFAVNIQIKQLANLQRIEIPIELHESYIISINYAPAYAATLGQACQAYEKIPQKAHTREHIKSQLQTTAYTQKDLYCSMYHQFIEQTTTYMKHKSLVGAFIVCCSSHRSYSKLARKKLLCLQ